MTEKEFEQLKVGDKVWKVSDWYEHDYKAYQFEVVSINYVGKHIIAKGGFGSTACLPYSNCYLHCSEAWGEIVRFYEEKIKDEEADIVVDKKALDRYKAELAKAKEEEDACWITDSGEVRKVRKSDYPCYIHYATEREAYEALAKFHKGKYEEALSKAGKIGYSIFSMAEPRILTVFNPTMEDGYPIGVDYDGCRFAPVCSGWFNTRQEAEAELERRKK